MAKSTKTPLKCKMGNFSLETETKGPMPHWLVALIIIAVLLFFLAVIIIAKGWSIPILGVSLGKVSEVLKSVFRSRSP